MNNKPLISIVTISFNQAEYLEECILSVIEQDYPNIEYIICDPGSTDGSRDIIEKYRDKIAHIIYDKDSGPADGLNKGFEKATGDIYCYLNSDDMFTQNAFKTIVNFFNKNKNIDIFYGHGYVIDEKTKIKRKCFSDPFSLTRTAYGACVTIQPSTFFKAVSFKKTKGFNIDNKSNWDGELMIDMVLSGSSYKLIPKYLSNYRIYSDSITGSGKFHDLHAEYANKMFNKIMKRDYKSSDKIRFKIFRFIKHLIHPKAFLERVIYGPMFGAK